ncbi:nucleoid-associated protein, YbaB/EbfC family [Mangrovactinospora gilvigrisea]|uniref:Nucleoid-associated protein BIV57_18245 n=2 Tax=Mangrovactinospora gilvigrisea TaxID=1428644 RepID=A0A1J7C3C5_9ACTN|nr:nucleoid-associated protein, YbaB/EbfC family [Mangrovactinospora gilvigrisea]
MQEMLQQVQQMQADIARVQQELADATVDGTAGGGLVKATVSGTCELKALQIDPKAVDPEDTETLADLILAAVREANGNAQQMQAEKLGPYQQMLGAMGGGGMPGMPF